MYSHPRTGGTTAAYLVLWAFRWTYLQGHPVVARNSWLKVCIIISGKAPASISNLSYPDFHSNSISNAPLAKHPTPLISRPS